MLTPCMQHMLWSVRHHTATATAAQQQEQQKP